MKQEGIFYSGLWEYFNKNKTELPNRLLDENFTKEIKKIMKEKENK